MDGAEAQLYDSIRGEVGAYEQALAGINNLRRLNVPITFRRVLMAPNVRETDAPSPSPPR